MEAQNLLPAPAVVVVVEAQALWAQAAPGPQVPQAMLTVVVVAPQPAARAALARVPVQTPRASAVQAVAHFKILQESEALAALQWSVVVVAAEALTEALQPGMVAIPSRAVEEAQAEQQLEERPEQAALLNSAAQVVLVVTTAQARAARPRRAVAVVDATLQAAPVLVESVACGSSNYNLCLPQIPSLQPPTPLPQPTPEGHLPSALCTEASHRATRT